MAIVLIFDINQPALGKREIVLNSRKFEPITNLEGVFSLVTSNGRAAMVSFHDEEANQLFQSMIYIDEDRPISFCRDTLNVEGNITYIER